MRSLAAFLLLLVLTLPCHPMAEERPDYVLVEDCDGSPLPDGQYISYYYHIPVHPGLLSYYGWWPRLERPAEGYVIGQFFTIGDMSTGEAAAADPAACHLIGGFTILDTFGIGCVYPEYEGYATVEFDVYCADESGCPIGPSLWNSGPVETCPAWNYLEISPPISICGCSIDEGPPPSRPRVLLTATHVGTYEWWPEWGVDTIYSPYESGEEMHDIGCLPALFPRPHNSHYPTMHSGYYGPDFQYCPPQWFREHNDRTPDATLYGHVELAWRIYLLCTGPSETEATTWGTIKGMYR